MSRFSDRLYELLPAIYRLRDADQGGALKAFLGVVAEQIGLVEDDIGQLYDNWFIETCAEWLIPYIGDLLGAHGLHRTETRLARTVFTERARVANTLAYRRRKGTATMLEQLAHDTTQWNARAAEFFQLLGTTQYLNHPRPANVRTPDLRKPDALELLDGPFDTIAHTVDVRRIASRRGKYNIPNVGLYLWRLGVYCLEGVRPRPLSSPPDGRFTFSPLGNSAPLFNRPRTETTISHLAEERDVPKAIRPTAFYLDVQEYLAQNLPRDAARRAERSTYYGAGASLAIRHDGQPVPPAEVASMDLSGWARPPAQIRGALTAPLPASFALTAAATSTPPAVDATLGAAGPHTATLAGFPATPAQAAALLTEALQRADDSPAFQRAQAVAVDDPRTGTARLFILPGEPGLTVTFAAAAVDPATLTELKLDALVPVGAALSSLLKPFPRLGEGIVNVSIAGIGPREISLSPPPALPVADVPSARLALETAIRGADTDAAFTEARVLILDDRLLVMPGIGALAAAAGPVRFIEAVSDPAAVHHLGLQDRVGVDVSLGRIAFPLGADVGEVRVDYTYGCSGDLGGGPYDRRWLRQPGEPVPTAYQNSVAEPRGMGHLLRVAASSVTPPAEFATILKAIDHWANVLQKPDAVIEICDNDTYEEHIALEMGTNDLVIQAENKKRPLLRGDIVVSGGGRLTLNGLLIAGNLLVEEDSELHQLDLLDTTLVPGGGMTADGRTLDPDRPSVAVATSFPELKVSLSRSISGPLYLPVGISNLEVRDSIIESPLRGRSAMILPALVSGPVAPAALLDLSEAELEITIGEEGPFPLMVSRAFRKRSDGPITPAALALGLEHAIRHAHASRAFRRTQVFREGKRLIVVPGTPANVSITSPGGGSRLSSLGLDARRGKERVALVSGPIRAPLSASHPELVLTLRDEHATIRLAPPATEGQVRDSLETAIRAASASTAFKKAIVLYSAEEHQIVVVPGEEGIAPRFSATATDETTLDELSLASDRFAIAALPTGEQPAPPTTLVRTTVLGPVHVRELILASETILDGALQADRRQSGCTRFSFVPDGSRAPRRYRCQPQLEMDAQLGGAEAVSVAERDRIQQGVLTWLKPSYTSTRFGDPAYGQLSLMCPSPIRSGAEDGGEMGAFGSLKQPQRERNLLASLDEYLRVGLEAGLFYET